MRISGLLVMLLVVAGCGSSAAGNNATSTPTTRHLHWSHPPAMAINQSTTYKATVQTTDGTFVITLLPKIAPITVNNFVFLARQHYFDGVIFHRILQGEFVQTGDPTGTGFGGPGYHIKNEKVTLPYSRGTVAMANAGANTGGSQFFIIESPGTLALPPQYTIFGKVTSGMNVVDKIAASPVVPSAANSQEVSSPVNPPVMKRVTISPS